MGQILSAPITEKHSEKGEDKYYVYALSCMQGWRMSMEDSHTTVLNLNALKTKTFAEDDEDIKEDDEEEEEVEEQKETDHVAFFGVYDGHGGEKAAIYTGDNLHQIVKNTEAYAKKDYINALKEGFLSCDQHILRDWRIVDDDSGCAATSVIITPDTIYCGNAGDSRTVMSINGFAKALSFDHKPSNEGEKARISNAGGFVDMGRVNGNLALSRGIGDFEFKRNIDLPAEEQIVTALPDVLKHNINFDSDEFIVLACDGIWDCLTSQRCVECVRRGIYERKPLTQICEEIMELCCAPTTDGSGIGCDNMSISIVVLLDYKNNETLDQWYDKIISRIEKVNQELLISSSNITTNTTSTSASISHSTSTSSDVSSKSIPTPQSRTTTPSFKYGPISAPYEQIYKDMYGDFYELGQRGNQQNNGNQNGNGRSLGGGSPLSSISNGVFATGRSFGNSIDDDLEGRSAGHAEDDDEDDNGDISRRELNNGAISLQKLLASNAITNENGVIYLDTSSAQSILAHFGMGDDSPSTTTTSIEEEDEDDDDEDEDVDEADVHEKHIEEEDLEDDSKN